MLKEKNYIAFDFETTGLDTEKDEPIQIGLVQFDKSGTIINQYCSLIKPERPIKELKTIVRYLTGFSLDDLKDAPERDVVLEEVRQFFTDETVVVGHNIGFDCAMLEKYISVPIALQIDTFTLSKSLIHYQQSYALDALHNYLVKNDHISPSSSEKAHDALHDSFMAYDLFMHCIQKIQTLRRKNVLIDYAFERSVGYLESIIQRTPKAYKFQEKELFLPPLHAATTTTPKRVLTPDSFTLPTENHSVINAYNSSFSTLLQSINFTEKHWIITATHRSKLLLIENVLNQRYIEHTTLADQVYFDKDAVNTFLHKEHFDDGELFFLLKYFSQQQAGHKQLEINSSSDYKIFFALTQRRQRTRGKVTLCTHQQLRHHSHKINSNDTILFLDYDWWYNSYNNAHKKSIDPYHLMNLLEQLEYKWTLLDSPQKAQKIQETIDQFTVFLGILFGEINQYFVGWNGPTREFSFIIDDTRFPKTRGLFATIKEQFTSLIDTLDNDESMLIEDQFTNLEDYLHDQTTVEKKMYDGNKWRYLFHRNQIFVDYNEFIESLPEAHYYFVTTNNQKNSTLTLNHDKKNSSILNIHTNAELKTMHKKLAQETTVAQFILSTSKEKSKELFQSLVEQGLHEKYTIVAENITGGVGKCIVQATDSDKPLIALGGYMFYMELLAKKFAFSDLFVYYLYGAIKQQILTDLVRYST